MWFGMLGPLLVRLDDQEWPVAAAKQRVLLAALLLTPGQPLPASRLSELVWDGRPPRGSAVTLRTYVLRLRQALGPGGSRIVTAGGGYLIEAADDEVDITRYASLCALGEAAVRAGAWPRAADLLTQAQSLWRGDPLADIACQELQVTEVPRLEQLRLQAIQWRVDADLHLGRSAQCVPELYALTAQYPLSEPFHHQLMDALHRCDRRADALAAYRRARDVLVSEIGLEPGPQLRALHQRILADDQPPEAKARTDAAPASPSSSASPGQPPRQLPPPVMNFVGRSAELGELAGLLTTPAGQTGATKIAVISGAAGIGKTALAVGWAHRVAGSFPDGQIYLNLNGFGPAGSPLTPADAIARVLEALAVPQAWVPASLDGQVGLYRTLLSERRTLIVLDNAKDAEQVRPLLPGGDGCLVLVTSRSPLTGLVALVGARALNLDVLTKAEARQMVSQRLGSGQAAIDQEAVDDLIDACARLPLALAIATALVATRPGQSLTGVAGNLRRPDARLGVLSTGGDATSNLRAVFYWSYQALTGPAARMFRLLAEHPGPDISARAAASLCGLAPAASEDALIELADLHLIDSRGHGRFAVHDLLRLFAAELLAATDSEAERRVAGERLLDHYLGSAWAAAAALNPTRELLERRAPATGVQPEEASGQGRAIGWLKTEHQVLMRAIEYAGQAGFDTHAWQLAWALTDFLDRGGHWSDFAASQRLALAAATRIGDRAARARAHRYIGRACFRLRDFDAAIEHLTRALELRRELREPVGEAGASLDLCRPHEKRGDIDEALGSARRALRLYRAAGHLLGEATALNSVGWYHAKLANYPAALGHCGQALDLCVELGDKMGQGHTWHSLGYVHQRMGNSAQAIDCYRRAVDLYRQLDERPAEAEALTDLGDSFRAAGDLGAACRAWSGALTILVELGHPDADQVRARLVRTVAVSSLARAGRRPA